VNSSIDCLCVLHFSTQWHCEKLSALCCQPWLSFAFCSFAGLGQALPCLSIGFVVLQFCSFAALCPIVCRLNHRCRVAGPPQLLPAPSAKMCSGLSTTSKLHIAVATQCHVSWTALRSPLPFFGAGVMFAAWLVWYPHGQRRCGHGNPCHPSRSSPFGHNRVLSVCLVQRTWLLGPVATVVVAFRRLRYTSGHGSPFFFF